MVAARDPATLHSTQFMRTPPTAGELSCRSWRRNTQVATAMRARLRAMAWCDDIISAAGHGTAPVGCMSVWAQRVINCMRRWVCRLAGLLRLGPAAGDAPLAGECRV
jgi:hypothetical protein